MHKHCRDLSMLYIWPCDELVEGLNHKQRLETFSALSGLKHIGMIEKSFVGRSSVTE